MIKKVTICPAETLCSEDNFESLSCISYLNWIFFFMYMLLYYIFAYIYIYIYTLYMCDVLFPHNRILNVEWKTIGSLG